MDNIGDILSSLSDSDIEKLKETAKNVFGENFTESNSENNEKPGAENFDFSSLNPQIISKVSSIMNAMNKSNPRCDLIASLKPLLSDSKKHKADEALQIMRLFEVIPLLKDFKGR